MIKTALEIVELSEIKKTIKENSLESFFTSFELKKYQVGRPADLINQAPTEKNFNLVHLAGKLAAKKAFLNAFDKEREYKKVEIKNSPSGKPAINVLDTNLKNEISDYEISISISHTKNIAVAFCLIYDKK